MALTATSHISSFSFTRSPPPPHRLLTFPSLSICTATNFSSSLSLQHPAAPRPSFRFFSASHGGGGGERGGSNSGGGGGGDGDAGDKNRAEAIMALADSGRSLDSLPKDLAAAIEAGKIPGMIVHRYFELEKSAVFRWLLNFGGFKERLLADDLFLTKVGIECGVGIFTKTAAELEKRREKFSKELDFVFADVVMAIIADFMLVWLPAPTVSVRPSLAIGAGPLNKFFYNCPDNAFQVALAGTSYSFLQRIGAIVRNGAKLFAVGTGASLVGTGITNALINVRKAFDKSFALEAEDLPILATSAAYGVYMAVSSNLRYQILAGVIEQRILEPLLHNKKIVLSVICFAVRTGNTFLGSLMWVDYARWVGIQKERE
ncbi:PREDICTED: protein RETICULATA-RELATED 4, chloroplastic-like [Ipomoea nil]|uniref:protein RETICULATA-RELATED 4, chloroplastic-like n=1 Tax=Ipomoea nil TaxID=35883 RepID=UPI000900C3FF|nr:PREDICTED: protein RETICULATA-RELATED 4, chloroplastic-like [Ipomoea nil]